MSKTITERFLEKDPSLWEGDPEALNKGTPGTIIHKDTSIDITVITSFRHEGELKYLVQPEGILQGFGWMKVVDSKDIII